MQSLELPSRSVGRVVIESFSWTAIATAAFLGNVLVCVAFFRNPVLRRLTPVYVIALAISDILNCCTNAVFVGVTLITGNWRFGDNGCFVCGMSMPFLTCVTISTMSLTAINRFIKATKPELFRTVFSPKRSVVIVIGLWILVALIILLSFYVGNNNGDVTFVFYPGYAVCLPLFQGKFHVYPIIIYASFMTMSLVIVPVCYYKVHRAFRQVRSQDPQAMPQPREPQENQHQQVAHQPNNLQANHHTGETQDSHQLQDPRANQQPEEAQTLLQGEETQRLQQRREQQASQHPQGSQTADLFRDPQAAHQPEELPAVKKQGQTHQAQTVQSCPETQKTQQSQPPAFSKVSGSVEPQKPQELQQLGEPQTIYQLTEATSVLKKVPPQRAQATSLSSEPQTAKQPQERGEKANCQTPESQTTQQLDEPQDHYLQPEPQVAHHPQKPLETYQRQGGQKSQQHDTLYIGRSTHQPQGGCNQTPQEPHTAQNVMKAKEAKITKMMFAIVLAFMLLWIPIFVIIIVTRFSLGTVPREIAMLVLYGSNISSLINPVLYAIMSRSYRTEFKDVLWSIKFYVSDYFGCCEC